MMIRKIMTNASNIIIIVIIAIADLTMTRVAWAF